MKKIYYMPVIIFNFRKGELYKTIDELKKEISALKAENQMLKNKLQNQQN